MKKPGAVSRPGLFAVTPGLAGSWIGSGHGIITWGVPLARLGWMEMLPRHGGFPDRKPGLPDLRTHKKTDLGPARDRRATREFQFPEQPDL
jgi:hypothetical protein